MPILNANWYENAVAYFGSLFSVVNGQFQAGSMTGYDMQ